MKFEDNKRAIFDLKKRKSFFQQVYSKYFTFNVTRHCSWSDVSSYFILNVSFVHQPSFRTLFPYTMIHNCARSYRCSYCKPPFETPTLISEPTHAVVRSCIINDVASRSNKFRGLFYNLCHIYTAVHGSYLSITAFLTKAQLREDTSQNSSEPCGFASLSFFEMFNIVPHGSNHVQCSEPSFPSPLSVEMSLPIKATLWGSIHVPMSTLLYNATRLFTLYQGTQLMRNMTYSPYA